MKEDNVRLVPVSTLTPHPKNDYFFDDITGDSWTTFLRSIETSGVKQPVVITKDNVIVSGHQRVRACKKLHIKKVLAVVEEFKDEDELIKCLIETNLEQRNSGNPNPIKLGRCIRELERIYGIRNGGNRGNQYQVAESNNFTLANSPKTESDLAEQMGLTRQTLQNYKTLADSIPEIQELVNTNKVTPTTALAIIKKLPEDQQKELAEQIADKGGATGKEANRMIAEMQGEPIIKEVEVIKEVPPNDYEELKAEKARLEEEIMKLKESKNAEPDEEPEEELDEYGLPLLKKTPDENGWYGQIPDDLDAARRRADEVTKRLIARFRAEDELGNDPEKLRNQILEMRKEIEGLKENAASKDEELASKDEELASKDEELASKDEEIVSLKNQVESGKQEVTRLRNEVNPTDAMLTNYDEAHDFIQACRDFKRNALYPFMNSSAVKIISENESVSKAFLKEVNSVIDDLKDLILRHMVTDVIE